MPITLVRGLSEQVDSMRRFGEAIEAGLGERPDVELRSLRMVASPAAGPGLVGRVHRNIDEFVRFPAAVSDVVLASGSPTTVFHITDSAHAHVISRLPAQRTVVSCHDVRELRAREVAAGPVVRDRLRMWRTRAHVHGMKRAGAVVCSSVASRGDIAALTGVPERRIAVIPKGVGDAFVVLPEPARARARAELYAGRHVVLSVGAGSAGRTSRRSFARSACCAPAAST